jgi:hypothetical protein
VTIISALQDTGEIQPAPLLPPHRTAAVYAAIWRLLHEEAAQWSPLDVAVRRFLGLSRDPAQTHEPKRQRGTR